MALTNAGGTVVSFNNTPQAADDTYTQTNDTYGLDVVLKFDVMSNDLGGGAKSLYSVDDGTSALTGTKVKGPADLLDFDKDHAFEATQYGCDIQVTADGQLGIKLTQAFLDFLDTFDVGTFQTLKFTYAIQLGNGTPQLGYSVHRL